MVHTQDVDDGQNFLNSRCFSLAIILISILLVPLEMRLN